MMWLELDLTFRRIDLDLDLDLRDSKKMIFGFCERAGALSFFGVEVERKSWFPSLLRRVRGLSCDKMLFRSNTENVGWNHIVNLMESFIAHFCVALAVLVIFFSELSHNKRAKRVQGCARKPSLFLRILRAETDLRCLVTMSEGIGKTMEYVFLTLLKRATAEVNQKNDTNQVFKLMFAQEVSD